MGSAESWLVHLRISATAKRYEGEGWKNHWPTVFRIHSPHSFVPKLPPTSGVIFFWCTAFSTVFSIFSDSAVRPKWASIIAAVKIAPIGLARFLPAMVGAEPCTGSNIEVFPG